MNRTFNPLRTSNAQACLKFDLGRMLERSWINSLRSVCLMAMVAIMSLAGASSAQFIEDQRSLEDAIKNYLLENPQIIVDALQRYEQLMEVQAKGNELLTILENAEELFYDEASWVGGNPEGDVTLVEFVDYRCGFCRRAAGVVKQAVSSDGNIRFVVKEFPILGEQSEWSARLAIAVLILAGADAYQETHDFLITLDRPIDNQTIQELATRFEIDAQTLTSTAGAAEVTGVIQRNYELANRLAINGTPAFVIGGRIYRGLLSAEDLQLAVESAREDFSGLSWGS